MRIRSLSLYMALLVSMQTSAFQLAEEIKFESDREQIVKRALSEKGKPYRWNQNGPDSFDCSGFVHFVLKVVLGPVQFPMPYNLIDMGSYHAQSLYYRDYLKQRKADINCRNAKKADIVFFPASNGNHNHIGLIVDNRTLTFITAQSRSTGVQAASFDRGSYWAQRKPECFTNLWVK